MVSLGIRSGRIFEIFRKRFTFISKDFKSIDRKMVYYSDNGLLKILKINDSDLCYYFNNMSLDFAIIGSDFYYENNLKYRYLKVNVFKCRLSLISTGSFNCNTNRICTKYNNIISSLYCFSRFSIQKIYGSLEVCLCIGLCDYIVDIVDSGETLKANNLKEVLTLKYIYSILVMNTNISKYKLNIIKSTLHITSDKPSRL
ncbi:ATP phosphoribosyltransferase [Candidatus Vidania fulgoroideorum]